jgi:cation/acetate symporter
VAGMLAGLGVTVYYLVANAAPVRAALGLAGPGPLWFGILPVSAGVFGVALGAAVTWVVSLCARRGAARPVPDSRAVRTADPASGLLPPPRP